MKKLVSMICVLAILCSFGTAFAVSTDEYQATTLPSDVVVERVDVPLSVAMTDASFSISANAQDATVKNDIETKAVTWNVWGEKTLNLSTHLYYPVGYSEHKNGSTVLDTYHYTRTFLGSSLDPRGDSGRVWGTYTVQANGTDCIADVWDLYIHRVYYGTED